MIQFTKTIDEEYTIALDCTSLVPDGMSIESATASAIDITNLDSDATAIVLESATPVVSIQGTNVLLWVQAGTANHKYEIDVELSFTPGSPTPFLDTSIIMNVE